MKKKTPPLPFKAEAEGREERAFFVLRRINERNPYPRRG